MLFLPDRVEDHSPETEIWHECHLDDVTFSDGRKVHVGLKVEEFPHGALSGEQDIVTSTLQRADGSQISDVMVVGQLKYSLAANDDGGST